jgi:hypothetical protein
MFVLACSRAPTTPPGPIGEVDLASRLPAGVTVPAQLAAREASQDVCNRETGYQPARVHVRWKTFDQNGKTYVSSYAVELEKGASGLTLKLDGDPTLHDLTKSERPTPTIAVEFTLKCTRVEGSLIMDGTSKVVVRGDGVSGVH